MQSHKKQSLQARERVSVSRAFEQEKRGCDERSFGCSFVDYANDNLFDCWRYERSFVSDTSDHLIVRWGDERLSLRSLVLPLRLPARAMPQLRPPLQFAAFEARSLLALFGYFKLSV